LRDRVLFSDEGLDSINEFDYREWLLNHGGTKTSVNSRFVTGIYDLMFAYHEGDRSKPQLAAGVALRGAFRMFFTYRGAMFYRLRSGMGDAIFAPLYEVLQTPHSNAKGGGYAPINNSPVGFHFLHELISVEFTQHGRCVSSLGFTIPGEFGELDAQSAAALNHNGCWPETAEDCFLQAKDPQPRERKLIYGEHFDAVILAMGVDDFKTTCASLLSGAQSSAEWVRMCDRVQTVATQSAQVWLDRDLEDLGWYRGSGLFTGLGLAFDTWADMTHTLAVELQTPGRSAPSELDKARSVAYFCGPLPESAIQKHTGARGAQLPNSMQRYVEQNLTKVLKEDLRLAWPAAFEGRMTARNRELLRHAQANFKGSDRYTLSLPGTISARISPLERLVENMTIAGDWTACGLDTGCVEAAVISGMLAAYAISGEQPHPSSIVGYDHP
jgi:uncharacterized protein with NAD-binding domain and iron-sulfur cluster